MSNVLLCRVLIKAPEWFVEKYPDAPKQILAIPESITIGTNICCVDSCYFPEEWDEEEHFWLDYNEYEDYYSFEYVELMLYIGLEDNIGKLIYVGDIVEMYDELYLVAFDGYQYLLKLIGSYQDHTLAGMYVTEDIEILGNIYENPQLLTVMN